MLDALSIFKPALSHHGMPSVQRITRADSSLVSGTAASPSRTPLRVTRNSDGVPMGWRRAGAGMCPTCLRCCRKRHLRITRDLSLLAAATLAAAKISWNGSRRYTSGPGELRPSTRLFSAGDCNVAMEVYVWRRMGLLDAAALLPPAVVCLRVLAARPWIAVVRS